MTVMAEDKNKLAVPASRLTRLARIGGMGAGVAGNMLAEGTKRRLAGEKPTRAELLMTPTNAARVAEQLSQLRGAAMKVGQLLSMDGGDLIPPELAGVFEKLRQDAHAMPPKQLRRVLGDAWGRDWLRRFDKFEPQPMAAASIGQVHRGRTKDGRDLAVKVQYPGVRDAIASDVDNVATLVRMTGMLPDGVDVKPLLEEAKTQLAEEADYEREASCLRRFSDLLAGDDRFVLPGVHDDFTTRDVLAMDHVAGTPIEEVANADQATRDRVVTALMDLTMKELLAFRFMQTDPNFANYFYQQDTGKVVLLDFGATREVPEALSAGYGKLLAAGMVLDWPAVRAAAVGMGLADDGIEGENEETMAEIFEMAMEPMRHEGLYDFGATDLAMRMRDHGIKLRTSGFNHVPPPAAVFFHRKFGGTYLLATKLKARVDVGSLLRPYLPAP